MGGRSDGSLDRYLCPALPTRDVSVRAEAYRKYKLVGKGLPTNGSQGLYVIISVEQPLDGYAILNCLRFSSKIHYRSPVVSLKESRSLQLLRNFGRRPILNPKFIRQSLSDVGLRTTHKSQATPGL